MSKKKAFLTTILLIFISNVISQDSNCVSYTTCDSCLEVEGCAWCVDRTYDPKLPRCMNKLNLIQFNCSLQWIQESREMKKNIFQDEPLSDFTRDNEYDAFQIRPQRVKMMMKKGTTQEIKMKFRPARNYPLDLYYLMDLTWTMKDDKETLVTMGGSLANALNNLTENNRLGFGSFADKPTIPYIMISETEKLNPCSVEQNTCAPTYLYRHHLSLTDDINQFIKEVNKSVVTGNMDNIEGGLEALMQVLVCDDRVGWSERSRKIVIFATDGWMHVAGFGLLGGAPLKNDGKCHIDSRGEYRSGLTMDYPSLEEIYRELVRRKVNVIFAVTDQVLNHYNGIKSLMPDQSNVGMLQADSSNVLQLVETGFTEFVRKVNFIDDAPDYFKVEYLTKCGDKYADYVSQSSCDNIEIGKEYEFLIQVTLLDSPEIIGLERQTIKIEEASLSDEYLQLEIELEMTCPCMKEEIGDPKSMRCNENGEFKCGMCLCYEGFVGSLCDCNLKNYTSSQELDAQCRHASGRIEGEILTCSGRGECLCGVCYCEKGFEGKFCECNKCLSDKNGRICSGNGVCDCGKCSCRPEWTGDNCECTSRTETCIAPGTDEICSGKGECICGACQCTGNNRGQFCEHVPGGLSSLCKFYDDCVEQTILEKLGKTNDISNCTAVDDKPYTIQFTDDLPAKTCYVRIKYDESTSCGYDYSYELDKDNHPTLTILNQECPPTDYAFIGFLTVFISTMLIGLFLICLYFICIKIKDKREYAKFEMEQKEKTRYSLNMSPIYKSPITKYEVPQFTFEPEKTQEFQMIRTPSVEEKQSLEFTTVKTTTNQPLQEFTTNGTNSNQSSLKLTTIRTTSSQLPPEFTTIRTTSSQPPAEFTTIKTTSIESPREFTTMRTTLNQQPAEFTTISHSHEPPEFSTMRSFSFEPQHTQEFNTTRTTTIGPDGTQEVRMIRTTTVTKSTKYD
uniref:Integrin beta n=1 Tax=Culicoides sonorensis TaxID=179676 RepID=A0A336LEA7_CULSO